MKTIKTSMLALFLVSIATLFSCSEDFGENTIPTPLPEGSETNINTAYTGVTFNGNAVMHDISGDECLEIKKALEVLIPNKASNVDETTQLLIIPKLSDVYKEDIEQVYDNGGVIAVVNPSMDNIKQWSSKNAWNTLHVDNDVNDAMIFSFNNMTHHAIVAKPNHDTFLVNDSDIDNMSDKEEPNFFFKKQGSSKDSTENVEQDVDSIQYETSYIEDNYSDMYTYLSHWVSLMNNDLNEMTTSQKTRGTALDDVKGIFRTYPYSATFSFSKEEVVRETWAWFTRKKHTINGNGSISVAFDIYQIHCYEGQQGAGDYYLVNMTASVANEDMYRGKWWNTHKGWYVRLCGLYGTNFEVECAPVFADDNTKVYANNQVYFTASGFPSPSTTNGKTQYSRSVTESFNLGGTGSVGSGSEGIKGEAGIKISGGWSWAESDTRDISDTDIQNNSYGNIVRYKLTFQNLPKYEWSEERGFAEGNSWTYRSTSDIRAYWVWYVPGIKDDNKEQPISIRFRANASYGAMSFLTTKADLETKNFDQLAKVEKTFNLVNFIRDKRGTVTICNNFSDNRAIMDIEIYEASDKARKDTLWKSEETIISNKEKTTTALPTNKKYMIYITTDDGKKFSYSKNADGLSLKHGNNVTVYAAHDFKQY